MNSAVRVSLHYISIFSVTGVALPFAGLWLSSKGMSRAEIGLLLALPMLGRLLTGPLLAVWADGFRRRRSAIAIMGLVMALAYGLAGLVDNIWLRGLCWFVAATATAAMFPLGDVLALKLARRDGYPFSLPRGFGSLAFVLANLTMGALLTRASVEAVIIWIVTASSLCCLISLVLLPAIEVTEGQGKATVRDRFRGVGGLFANRTFMLAVMGIAAIQASHGFYYGFSAILWKAQGMPESYTGMLWAFAVAVEVAFMWVVEPWRRRFGISAFTLVAVGAGAAVLRWTLMAVEPSIPMLWVLQVLHALTFAATYLGSVEIVDALSPPKDHTASQTLSSMLSSGLMTGLATALSGPLSARFGAAGYLGMTLIAVGGLIAILSVRLPIRRALQNGAGASGAVS